MALDSKFVMKHLATLYGWPERVAHGDAVAELVLTILSQNTADTNSGRAFIQLARRFPSWSAIAAAPLEDVVDAISIGGLARQKAPRIQAVLRTVGEGSPGWNLDSLRTVSVEDARAWLRALPGVGPKTAACVLLFALGRPAMPVDTHVERVAKRLGLVSARTTTESAHHRLEALVEATDYYPFHMLLIKHGRRTCVARTPACARCPLAANCPTSTFPGRDAAVVAGNSVFQG